MTVTVGLAQVSDAVQAAQLADAKRLEYQDYSPVFWRVAANAIELHEPWLAKCIADTDRFTSFAARDGETLSGIAIAAHSVFPPPFRFDPQPSWLVDDFFVSSSGEWRPTGVELMRAVEAAATEAGAERLIVLAARRDAPKREMLEGQGYERGASWWVLAVEPAPGEPPQLHATEAVTGPAPPVYDPGGTTALALRMPDPRELPLFGRWAAALNAVLAIVPARSTEPELEAALHAAGYEPASDWFIKGRNLEQKMHEVPAALDEEIARPKLDALGVSRAPDP